MCATQRLEWICRNRHMRIGRIPLVMGILNVTPDSFSDGGLHAGAEDAGRHGLRMVEEGADIIDIGGESTRPGARAVSEEEELKRVIPVVEFLRRESDICLSIDTTKAAVARAALEAGVDIVNDVTALEGDPDMCEVARKYEAGAILMHMRGNPRTMQQDPHYGDVVREICVFLESRAEALVEKGIERERLAIDPGIGFGKTIEHNLKLLAHLHSLTVYGLPVVVGLSRKSFLGKLTDRAPDERLAGSLGALAYCVMQGAHVMRVHDVKQSVDVIRTVGALMAAERGESIGVA